MFNFFTSRATVSLPQHDQAKHLRQLQLAEAKLKYTWDYKSNNLPGLPMMKHVRMLRKQRPNFIWWVKTLEIFLRVIENGLATQARPTAPTSKQADNALVNLYEVLCLLVRLSAGRLRNILRRTPKTTPDAVNPQPANASVAQELKLLGGITHVTWNSFFQDDSQKTVNAYADLYALMLQAVQKDTQAFKALFKTLPLPAIADQLLDDAMFARMRLAGPNPTLIQGITVLPAKFPVTNAGYQQVMPGDTLTQALKEKRVYLLDYAELQSFADNPDFKNPEKIFTQVFAPLALFALSKDRSQFKAIAIQGYQSSATLPIVYAVSDPSDPAYWDWQTLKAMVQNADANYHELLAHLSRTHLFLEAFAIATPRYFAQNHPLYRLLLSHFEGTLWINWLAEHRLVKTDGAVDQVFGAKIDTIRKAAVEDCGQLDFSAAMLPNDLKRRQVACHADLPDYPYRDDAELLWNAIQRWVSNYIAVYYPDDATLLADTELNAWNQALLTEIQVKGLPKISNCSQLTEVITMIIFTASVQHAAVNFPQSALMSYLPVFPGSLTGIKPLSANTESDWLNYFPAVKSSKIAQEQLNLFHALGSVYYGKLGNYRQHKLPYAPLLNDPRITQSNGPLEQFLQDLQQIEQTIQERNQTRVPYTYLLPSNIPASINI